MGLHRSASDAAGASARGRRSVGHGDPCGDPYGVKEAARSIDGAADRFRHRPPEQLTANFNPVKTYGSTFVSSLLAVYVFAVLVGSDPSMRWSLKLSLAIGVRPSSGSDGFRRRKPPPARAGPRAHARCV